MTRFSLRAVDEDGTVSIKQFESYYLSEVVEKCQDFLLGVGFVFDELVYTVDDNSKSEESDDEPEVVQVYDKVAETLKKYRYRATD